MIPQEGDGGEERRRLASDAVQPIPSNAFRAGDVDLEAVAQAIYEASVPPGNHPPYSWAHLPEPMRAFWLRRGEEAARIVWATAYAAAATDHAKGNGAPPIPPVTP